MRFTKAYLNNSNVELVINQMNFECHQGGRKSGRHSPFEPASNASVVKHVATTDGTNGALLAVAEGHIQIVEAYGTQGLRRHFLQKFCHYATKKKKIVKQRRELEPKRRDLQEGLR
jgi:hypothetical protein